LDIDTTNLYRKKELQEFTANKKTYCNCWMIQNKPIGITSIQCDREATIRGEVKDFFLVVGAS
jgi:hypothetical protein